MNICELCKHASISYSLSGHHLDCLVDLARFRREYGNDFGNNECAYFVSRFPMNKEFLTEEEMRI